MTTCCSYWKPGWGIPPNSIS